MNILVAIDRSPGAQAALAAALARQWPEGTSFRILTVLSRRGEGPIDRESMYREFGEAHRLIDRVTSELEGLCPDSPVAGQIDVGAPATSILRLAHSWPADLIIVGPHDRELFGRFFIGSVSKAVLQKADCSVLVARNTGSVPADVDNHVLVAVDDTAGSQGAIASILKSAWPKNTRFYLVTAAAPNQTMYSYEPSVVSHLRALDQRNEYLSSLDGMMQQLARCFESAFGPGSVGYSVVDGEPESVILDTAKRLDVQLITLGASGRPDFRRKLMGSVSEAVALKAHCSVQVMRSSVLPLCSRARSHNSTSGVRSVSGF